MTDTDTANPLEWFLNSLLQSTGQLMLIVDHMARHPNEAPDAEPFDDVLRTLLHDVLEDTIGQRDPADLAAAAALLGDAREVIGNELFLVDPDELVNGSCVGRPNRRERRRRRGAG